MSQILRENLERIQLRTGAAQSEFAAIQRELIEVEDRLGTVEREYAELFHASSISRVLRSRRSEASRLDEQRFELNLRRQHLRQDLHRLGSQIEELTRRREFFLDQVRSLVAILRTEGQEHQGATSNLANLLESHDRSSQKKIASPSERADKVSSRDPRQKVLFRSPQAREQSRSASKFLQQFVEAGRYPWPPLELEGLASDLIRIRGDVMEVEADEYAAAIRFLADHRPDLAVELASYVSSLDRHAVESERLRLRVRDLLTDMIKRAVIGSTNSRRRADED